MFGTRMHKALTALHVAVIENDLSAVEREARKGHTSLVQDDLGLSPFQLAQLLGRYDCLRLLGGDIPNHIPVQLKGWGRVKNLNVDKFREILKVEYRPYLTFSSYESLREVIKNCPYILRSRYLGEENYAYGRLYRNSIQTAKTADIYVRWIDEKLGYGVYASKEIPAETFVGEYTGVVRRLYRRKPDPNGYCLHYPTRFWSWKYYVIDALHEGNITRFINHGDDPNLKPLCTIEGGLLRQIFITNRSVKKGEQLLFDYGKDYWQKRQKLSL